MFLFYAFLQFQTAAITAGFVIPGFHIYIRVSLVADLYPFGVDKKWGVCLLVFARILKRFQGSFRSHQRGRRRPDIKEET